MFNANYSLFAFNSWLSEYKNATSKDMALQVFYLLTIDFLLSEAIYKYIKAYTPECQEK